MGITISMLIVILKVCFMVTEFSYMVQLPCVSPVCTWQSCASHLQSAHRHHCSAVGPAAEVMPEPAGGPEHHSPAAVQCGWSSLPLRCPDNTMTSWNAVINLDFVSNHAACGLTCVKVNFWVWVKWVPLVKVLSEGAEHLKVWRTSERSELEALWGGSSAAERSCSTMRLRSRVRFLLWCSCSTTNIQFTQNESSQMLSFMIFWFIYRGMLYMCTYNKPFVRMFISKGKEIRGLTQQENVEDDYGHMKNCEN